MGTKSFLFRIFFPTHSIFTKIWHNVQLGMTKKTRGEKAFCLYYTKSYWVWNVNFDPIFKLKIGQNSHFKLNNFFSVKDRRFVDRAFFFCYSKLYLMSKFGSDRTNRKKMRNKILLVPMRCIKLRFSKIFAWSRVLLDEWNLFDLFWPPHLSTRYLRHFKPTN